MNMVHTARNIPADWSPYSQDSNLQESSIERILQTNAQATPHANMTALCPSIATEWDWLVGETSAKPFTHSAAAG
jgi:hypothetical protein